MPLMGEPKATVSLEAKQGVQIPRPGPAEVIMRTILIDCPACCGDGVIEHLWSYDPRDGSPVGYGERCDLCHGTGMIEEELLPIEQEDLDERDGSPSTP
jgi:hypothetical protein